MKIHEYQAKELYQKYGIPTPKGIPCFNVDEAEAAAAKLIEETGNEVVVVKAQIHAGGRGKAGGVKVVKGAAAAKEAAEAILGATLVTPQTGPELARQLKTLHDEIIKYIDEMAAQISGMQDRTTKSEAAFAELRSHFAELPPGVP